VLSGMRPYDVLPLMVLVGALLLLSALATAKRRLERRLRERE